jgi:hypothetical protein
MTPEKTVPLVIFFSRLLQTMQSPNTYPLEALYKKYGMYPLQDGG